MSAMRSRLFSINVAVDVGEDRVEIRPVDEVRVLLPVYRVWAHRIFGDTISGHVTADVLAPIIFADWRRAGQEVAA